MIVVDKKRCKLCGICVSICPAKHLEIKGKEVAEKAGTKCTKCRLCEKYCPDIAIEVADGK